MKNTLSKLRGGTALGALALIGAFAAMPAMAQEAAPAQAATPTPDAAAEEDGSEIVVTGTMFAATAKATPSPVTVVSAESLERRGVSTIQDAIQQIASNNGPALTNSFTANGAFAGGASAVSLRGLSTNSTLVLFDGMRAAYYPLADDGTRNFVDLNTIPDDIVERIEVLRDGASSTYGADAIAGVVNIITKKEFKGLGARAEAGISERGDAGQYRASITLGTGDLNEDGLNAYVSGFYYRSEALYNRDREFPYNTGDLRGLCYQGHCGSNNIIDGLDENGDYPGFNVNTTSAGTTLYVAPFDPVTGAATGRYQMAGAACRITGHTLTAAELAANPLAPTRVCQEDTVANYGVISPKVERFGISGRVSARLGDDTDAYAEVNFLQTAVSNSGFPTPIRAHAPAPYYFPRYSTQANVAYYGGNTILQLPVYVCPRGTTGACTAANGRLNPNNPFASSGQTAALIGRLSNIIQQDMSRTRAFRGAIGIKGGITDNWKYEVNATAMHMDLFRRSEGYVYIQHLLDVIADGSYNFVNPFANSKAQNDYLAPPAEATSTSDLVQVQGTISSVLAELPGGPLEFGVGAALRYEAVDSPSLNSDIHGGTQRYFVLNGFATKGDRTVTSAFAELNAPIVDMVTVNLSGRYDRYSGGLDNFSPKIGLKFTPIRQVMVRGTYSRGFRVPSFGEANATFPTTGYVTSNRSIYPNSYLSQFGPTCDNTAAGFQTCPLYVRGATYGQTSLSNPNLQPEKARSFTVGGMVEPIRGVSFSVDYYNIKKTGAITTPNFAPAIQAYYSGNPIPAGYAVIPDAPFSPTTRPRIAFVQAQFINANTIRTEGLDFSANVDFAVTDGFRVRSSLDASYILYLGTEFPDGSIERYDGTSGNFNLTAGSGTPKWHGTWLTTLDFGNVEVNGTVNYFGSYDLSAMDQGSDYKDCSMSSDLSPCEVPAYVTFDLGARVKINDRFTFYANVLNLLDEMPPLDTATYGAYLYNPVQGGNGILGRYFRAGVRVGF